MSVENLRDRYPGVANAEKRARMDRVGSQIRAAIYSEANPGKLQTQVRRMLIASQAGKRGHPRVTALSSHFQATRIKKAGTTYCPPPVAS